MVKTKIEKELRLLVNPEKALILSYFFKTGPGQYGEGDIFLGVTVPQQRAVAKNNIGASLTDIQVVLDSKIHELRLTALLVLVFQYERAELKEKKPSLTFT